ncbi:MAG: threonine-phosphate decarboxylase [Rhodocyclales bacterium GWA2_65_20]|nr:MAG: threonine-phosphate decarboxylase [Rhodocyclales bacterium GWA2_65_20]
MTLFAIILALAIDQAKPLPAMRVEAWLRAYGLFLEGRFNAGERHQGLAAWFAGAAAPAALVLVLQMLLAVFGHPLLSLALGVGVLYLTMGFRQFSHFFTDIHLALRMGELDRARQLLAAWRGGSTSHLGSNEVARLAIEEALTASHRHVFAPLFWFVVLGPAGVLLYRLSLAFQRQWGGRRDAEFGDFGAFAAQAFAALDWLPVRATAASFAVVGDFEDAVYCWRNQAQRWPERGTGILLASGAGALGVRLGMPVREDGDMADRPELGLGDEADADFMQSTIGLVWRSLVMALFVLALLWVASWVGA